jgi:hypothetical protein
LVNPFFYALYQKLNIIFVILHMFKRAFIISCLLFAVIISCSAQKSQFSIGGVISIDNYIIYPKQNASKSYYPKLGYSYGLDFSYQANSKFYLTTGLRMDKFGYDVKYSRYNYDPRNYFHQFSPSSSEVDIKQITIPVNIGIQFFKKHRLSFTPMIGSTLSYIYNAHRTTTKANGNVDESDNYKTALPKLESDINFSSQFSYKISDSYTIKIGAYISKAANTLGIEMRSSNLKYGTFFGCSYTL